MSIKKIALLGVVLAGLLLYVSKVELAGDIEKTQTEKPYSSLVAQGVERIALSGSQGAFVLINSAPAQKQNDSSSETADTSLSEQDLKSWSIENIEGSELDRAALNGVISAIRNLNLESSMSKDEVGSDLAPYGLTKPELTIAIKVNGKDSEIKLGKMNDYVSRRYAQVSGKEGLFLVSAELYTAANKKSSDLRKHTPIELIDSEIKEITFSDAQTKIKVIRNDKNEWRLDYPIQALANDYTIENITRELRNLRAVSFVDGKDKIANQYGLNVPSLKVNINFKDNTKQPMEVLFGSKETVVGDSKESKYYYSVSGKPAWFEANPNPVGRIMRPIDELREKKLFKFAVDDVTSVEFIKKGSEKFTVAKEGEGWKIGDKQGDKPFVDQVVQALADVEASSFPQDTQSVDYGFSDPIFKVLVHLKDASKTPSIDTVRTLVVGKTLKDNSSYYAANEVLTDPFIISSETLKKISPHLEALLKSEAPTPSATTTQQNMN